ncbi:hypothetical protein [Pasteurella sp. PK-2025]|uniref:hypothetical protein n=1 Tax=Pasteurella sp. PK-2025 TaxID=3413133 RepID=UPI003C71882A
MSDFKKDYAATLISKMGKRASRDELDLLKGLEEKEKKYDLQASELLKAREALDSHSVTLKRVENELSEKKNLLLKMERDAQQKEQDLKVLKQNLDGREKLLATRDNEIHALKAKLIESEKILGLRDKSINELQGRLAEKEKVVSQHRSDLVTLKRVENELSEKKNVLLNMERDMRQKEQDLQALKQNLDGREKLLATRDNEIHALKAKLIDSEKILGLRDKSINELQDRLAEKEKVVLQHHDEINSIRDALVQKERVLADTRVSLELERLTNSEQLEAFKKQIKGYHDMESQLGVLKEKVKTSYGIQDVSEYLNQVISEFNESTASDNEHAKYVINNMDVDLKVRVYGDEKNDLRFTSPDVTENTKESLSSIKISIKAIPN